MNNQLKDVIRVATIVRRQLDRARDQDLDSGAHRRCQLAERMQRLAGLATQISRAARARYSGAVRRLQRRYDYQLDDLLNEIHHHNATRHQDGRPDHPLPTPRQILQELVQLEEEFGGWLFGHDVVCLSVDTEPIMLEGVPLGRFRIHLELNRLSDGITGHPFLIEALEPNPAAGADHVTHPHVSDQRPCLGEATTAIGAALRDGRLADAFMLVCNVLNTYNPDSPYVTLEDWDGDPCPDCGDRIYGDNRAWCELCDRDYCDRCVGTCQHCDNTTCYGCLSTCDQCEETICSSCMSRCADCGESCCQGCLEDGLCPICQETKESAHENEEETIKEEQAEANQPSEPTAA